jgi:chromosome partitioning protein
MKTRVIAIANQKGGVGKTTTSINLTACLTAKRKTVLLIDLDPQANATSGFGVEKTPGGSIYRPLIGEANIKDQIQATSYKRLDIIPSEIDLAGAEVDVARSDNYLHRLHDAIKDLVEANLYDYIMLDCPPSLGILTMNALSAADSVLIPMQCEYYALEGLSVMLRLIKQLRDSGANPRLDIEGIVMTMYDGRTNLAQQVVQEVINHFGDKVYETLIPRTVRLSEAPSFGQPIIVYAPRSTGAASYLELAKEFIRRRKLADQPPAPEPEPEVEPPAEPVEQQAVPSESSEPVPPPMPAEAATDPAPQPTDIPAENEEPAPRSELSGVKGTESG